MKQNLCRDDLNGTRPKSVVTYLQMTPSEHTFYRPTFFVAEVSPINENTDETETHTQKYLKHAADLIQQAKSVFRS